MHHEANERLNHQMKIFTLLLLTFLFSSAAIAGDLTPTHLRCEYLDNPTGIDATTPRLSWRVESSERGELQSAYQIWVASSPEKLAAGQPDVWDSGKIESDQTLFVRYAGKPLTSRQRCYWIVSVWDRQGNETRHSKTAQWSMGLLEKSDWKADYISYRDQTPIHTDTKRLFLPAARQYRKDFAAQRQIKHASLYATALGVYEIEINGKRVGDAMFAPGWTDYRQRAYYNTYDVTEMLTPGDNAIGAWLADGWYSGYVGFGLLTGMGTEKNGRYTYGKTPSMMAQLEIEYTDGTRDTIVTDTTWKVTGDGPIQEADLLMGESYDARREMPGWSSAGFDDHGWESAILASDNGKQTVQFYQAKNPVANGRPKIVGSPRELGFQRPKLEAFPGVPVRVTQELPAKTVTKRSDGTCIFDLAQNFAGTIRLKLNGPAGHRVTIRYGEMLHPDGRLMTENLRKARATDTYICKGDPDGETYQPRFTFHGFQFVEVDNFPDEPSVDAVTGLVVHSDTPMTSSFQCSDPMVDQLFKNVVWTQRANFLDLPTDCPQRDERMGWTGDAMAYVGTAAYNADIGAFYTKWLRELMESQRPSGAFPGYAPFPFQHGWDFGTAWADAGVICPWTIWQAYGDTQVIDDCWEPMVRFMKWRDATAVDDLGISHGNEWGDWLAVGNETPLEYVDSIYYAISAQKMAEMAEATGRHDEANAYRNQFQKTKVAFQAKYMRSDGSIKVSTQTAQALALFADLVPTEKRAGTGKYLAAMIAENGNHMATGFLGTRPLLPVLSESGQNDLAVFLLQSREFPSWGYEISNGATTIWERWDSYTKEDAFGRHNAAMNSFSHYAFGAVCEWMFHTLAGIQSDGPGYHQIIIDPSPPTQGSSAMDEPIDRVRASYESIRGVIRSEWRISGDQFRISVTVPANTTATVFLPTRDVESVTESGNSLADHAFVKLLRIEDGKAVLAVQSGEYQFAALRRIATAPVALKTSQPTDQSLNPDQIELTGATEVASWDFTNPADVNQWSDRQGVEIVQRDGNVYLVATGDDSKMATTLPTSLTGRLVIALRAMTNKGATSQFFWADSRMRFDERHQSRRFLKPSEQANEYLFAIDKIGSPKSLRFDPFNSYDEYADRGEMMIESITIYQLPE
jgi:alpha-L-rhamnosidase